MPDLLAGARYIWDIAFPSATYMHKHYGILHVALLPVYDVRRRLGGDEDSQLNLHYIVGSL